MYITSIILCLASVKLSVPYHQYLTTILMLSWESETAENMIQSKWRYCSIEIVYRYELVKLQYTFTGHVELYCCYIKLEQIDMTGY